MMPKDKFSSEEKLEGLFEVLRQTRNEDEAAVVEEMIWEIWMEGRSEETNTMMKRGCRFLQNENYDSAIRVFSRMIRRRAGYSEAWNKRATAYYLRGDYKRALDDITRTLHLEPRHFGALSGRASIQLVIGDHAGAVRTLERLYQLRPHKAGLRDQINDLHMLIGNEKRNK